MKAILLLSAAALALLVSFDIGLRVGERKGARGAAATRYELHSGGMPGLLVRFDKVTGETVVVAHPN